MRDPETGLTDLQLRFVHEFQVDHNATQAAIRAGYSKNGAAQRGLELLRISKIEKIIRFREAARLDSVLGSADWIIQQAAANAAEARAAGQYSAAAAHLALLAKRHPEFREGASVNIDARHITLPPGMTIDDVRRLRESAAMDG